MGGGVSPTRITAPEALDYGRIASEPTTIWSPGHFGLQTISIAGVGTDLPDVVLSVEWVIKNLCIAFNDLVGVTNPNGDPPLDTTPPPGNFTSASVLNWAPVVTVGDEATALIGKNEFCYNNNATDSKYKIHIVIISR